MSDILTLTHFKFPQEMSQTRMTPTSISGTSVIELDEGDVFGDDDEYKDIGCEDDEEDTILEPIVD